MASQWQWQAGPRHRIPVSLTVSRMSAATQTHAPTAKLEWNKAYLPAPSDLHVYLGYSTAELSARAPGLSGDHKTGTTESWACTSSELAKCIFLTSVYCKSVSIYRQSCVSDTVCSYVTDYLWKISNSQAALLSCRSLGS